MLYLDTSCLVPAYLREQTSEQVLSWLASLGHAPIAVSDWTVTEFTSAVGMKVRSGLALQEARSAVRSFRAAVAVHFACLPVRSPDFNDATSLLEQFDLGLRAGDALHLAVARNYGADHLYTFDKVMLKAATHFGVPASNPLES
jgi:predicted nucleic acid-binding protein